MACEEFEHVERRAVELHQFRTALDQIAKAVANEPEFRPNLPINLVVISVLERYRAALRLRATERKESPSEMVRTNLVE
jgi:hypothetical protein